MIQLRGYIVLDSLQPQLSAIISNTSKGYLPVQSMTSLFLEVHPAIFIHRLLDVAIKSTAVFPSMAIVEREYGVLEVHHQEQGEVRQAGAAVLDYLQLSESCRRKPRILSSQIIRALEPYHAQIVNKESRGQNVVPGQSLFILETVPAVYVAYAANQAEKAARIELVDVKFCGAFGRLYLAGSESEVDSAVAAAVECLGTLDGRETKD